MEGEDGVSRQWAVRTYDLWGGELGFVGRLIGEDLRNNSAWNHRYFVVANRERFTDEGVKRREEE